jgi:hypothetical protein
MSQLFSRTAVLLQRLWRYVELLGNLLFYVEPLKNRSTLPRAKCYPSVS